MYSHLSYDSQQKKFKKTPLRHFVNTNCHGETALRCQEFLSKLFMVVQCSAVVDGVCSHHEIR